MNHNSNKVKTCKCCSQSYDWLTWHQLGRLGDQVLPAEPELGLPEIRLELRNCGCGSTLTVKR